MDAVSLWACAVLVLFTVFIELSFRLWHERPGGCSTPGCSNDPLPDGDKCKRCWEDYLDMCDQERARGSDIE